MKIKLILFISLSLVLINNSYAANLQWSTYLGGSGDEESRALASDGAGNVYMTGWTTSTGISTNGSSFSGVYDAFLSKFNPKGKLLWTTYYGGSDIENSFGIALDKFGGIYICGNTASTDGIATTGAYQTKLGGFTDGFLAKFDTSGTRIWSTYFGGPLDDQASGIVIDSSANIYVTGFTLSANGIATAGAYQTQYGGGRNNGFLAKFDTSGSIKWATYYGGKQNDYSMAVTADNKGNVIIAGTCSSSNGIATSGAFRTSVGGYYDGFLAKFNSNGGLLWGSYFGNSGDDECTAIVTDTSGNIFITGNTSSNNGIATKGSYQSNYSGGINGYDVFLAKISENGEILWGTYYGGSGDDFTWGMDINKNQDIFISGYTNSKTGIATSGAYQVSLRGINNSYIVQFDQNGNLIQGSYLGGAGNDYAYAVKADFFDNVFIAGVTTSSSGIATKGAYSETLLGSTDAFLAKFSSPNSGIEKIPENISNPGIYPNPVFDHATMVYTVNKTSTVKIELFDIEGKLLTELKNDLQTPATYNYPLNINNYGLKAGPYYLRISTNYGVSYINFIKQ